METIKVTFNDQQVDVLRQFFDASDADPLGTLVLRALAEADPGEQGSPVERPLPTPPIERTIVAEHQIAPGTGKAIEVRAGQVLRIEQVEGGQCGDLNIFSLADRNESMHIGRTRAMEAGNSPTTGDIVWSHAPWERPLATVLQSTSRTDLLFPYCSALLYRKYFGTSTHTNCQQIQHEAQREYGLAPYDVHESWNLFMYVETDAEGGRSIVRNEARPQDYIEFYAEQDILAVPNVCGDDLGKSSNYFLRPLKAVVLEGTAADKDTSARSLAAGRAEASAPHPYTFDANPPVRDADYVASYPHLPLTQTSVSVTLDTEGQHTLEAVWNTALYPDDAAAALRDVTMTWMGKQLGDW